MRLHSRIKRVEKELGLGSGLCPVCQGRGPYHMIIEGQPVPPGCPRCGNRTLVVLRVVTPEEISEFHASLEQDDAWLREEEPIDRPSTDDSVKLE